MISWPSDLPSAMAFGQWQGGPQKNVASFQPEVGPSIDRLRSTATPEAFSTQIPRFSLAQKLAFQTFYRDYLKGGTLPFLMRDPEDGTMCRWKVMKNDPAYIFRQMAAGLWTLEIRLMKLP